MKTHHQTCNQSDPFSSVLLPDLAGNGKPP